MPPYSGRKGPNMSQYLRDLNAVSPQDAAGDDGIEIQEDLSFFANTQFYDLDSGQNTDYQAPPVKPEAVSQAPEPTSVMGEMSSIDFMNGEFLTSTLGGEFLSIITTKQSSIADILYPRSSTGDFNFSDFNAYTGSPMNSFSEGPTGFQSIQPSHGPIYGGHGHGHQGAFPQPPRASIKTTGEKRKSSDVSAVSTPAIGHGDHDDESRITAEEDKRRRNTAASARFRVKKKQREQALEKSAKEMSDKVLALESRVSQLETENKWLKNLLVEKNEGNEDITALWKEFTQKVSSRRPRAEAA
ncbi:Basic region leucine zipper [Geosmithia morbida]|uniref:Basic region leucine zipper n=1 Tax=Geosmithia morbida TaxID=1094350 RepID=A0A9P4Z220_9HYPO|nr:Basic region leucine zipper [Geosmithia morbida]KAF4125833.1 Basic region leucine zipper [Geosmithia morbida]